MVAPTEVPRRAPRPGEVRVRITAASLNYRDLLVAGGVGAARPEGPIPLSDGVGVVESVGAGSTFRVGQRVAANFFM
ncbi:MAG: alcohol dehydrogenase catalytic domain-containing protein, partial [Phyllobacteriaceae bacterium]|nr:alcohol dehydrogenase catalytic domain-containing protein [Phyllobacteriaceae bacterium]